MHDYSAPGFRAARLFEILQIVALLTLADRHQQAVRTELVNLVSDLDPARILDAQILGPLEQRLRPGAAVAAWHGPWPGQGMIDGRDLVVQHVRVGLVC